MSTEIKAVDMHWMREDIFRVCETAGMVRVSACCGVPTKICGDDKWEGNMEALFKHIEAEVRKKIQKEKNA